VDHKNPIATDIHTHAEVGWRNPFGHCGEEHDRAADKYFGGTRRATIAETIACFCERKIGWVTCTVDSESQLDRHRMPSEGISRLRALEQRHDGRLHQHRPLQGNDGPAAPRAECSKATRPSTRQRARRSSS